MISGCQIGQLLWCWWISSRDNILAKITSQGYLIMFTIYPLSSDYHHISPVWYHCAMLYKYLSCLVLTCQNVKQWQDLTGHTRVPQILWCYCDASHDDCLDTGRSTGGYLTLLGGGAIGWSSKLQSFVTLSTTEAEYIAAVKAGNEILWMCNILNEMGYSSKLPLPLHIDNQSALSVTKNPEHHGWMKQLDLSFFWLRNVVDRKQILPSHISGAEQVADLLTKPLPLSKVQFCRQNMGILT